MDDIKYDICRTQGEIFAYMAKKRYDVVCFAEQYFSSEFCKRAFDTSYSRFQLETPQECADFFLPQIKNNLRFTNKYQDKEEAFYIGFVYRYLYFVTNLPSSELFARVPIDRVKGYYIVSNLRTEDFVVEDLCKEYYLPLNQNEL